MKAQQVQEPQKPTFQQQYAEACQKAGEIQYRIAMHKIELRKLNKHLKKLNVDAHRELQKEQAVQIALAKKEAEKQGDKKLQAVPNEPEIIEACSSENCEAEMPEGPKDVA